MHVPLHHFGEQTAVGGKMYSRVFFTKKHHNPGTWDVSKYLLPNVGGDFSGITCRGAVLCRWL